MEKVDVYKDDVVSVALVRMLGRAIAHARAYSIYAQRHISQTKKR